MFKDEVWSWCLQLKLKFDNIAKLSPESKSKLDAELVLFQSNPAPHPSVEFHKIHFNSTKNTSATFTFVRDNLAS